MGPYSAHKAIPSCEMPEWRKHKLESRLPGDISITSDVQMIPPYGRKQKEPKRLSMKVKENSEKSGLKLNIQKTKIITADGDCSHEIKRCLLLGGKVMTNLESVLKSRDITLPTKGLYSQSYGFPSSHVWIVRVRP